VITIDIERCTGCGACVEVCPTSALYLVDGKATVDGALCSECEACLAACPSGAITLTAQEEPVAEAAGLPALRQEPEVIRVRTWPAPVPLRSGALPVVGAALAWAGREILPWLSDLLLDTLHRRTTGQQPMRVARNRRTLDRGGRGRGQQHRHRWRGGRA
jgi:NAD-dependent dihydropyrimidine dehydrogenase PreA subunit